MTDQSAARRTDARFMAEALALGDSRLGFTGPNPSVGCLIVRDDGDGPRVVGAAATAPGGRPHAETQALSLAGPLARGATAYVTLEPCSHHGRTPPCAEALIAAGVARVVIALVDPDSRVSGRGIAMLEAAGIAVETGVEREAAAQALEAYLFRKHHGRPFVTLKLAVSADGMIGRLGDGQVAITGPDARTFVHQLRARSDAILVGIRTAIADNPALTVRLPGLEERSPLRIVLDARLELPVTSVLARTARQVPTLVIGGETAAGEAQEPAPRQRALEELGVEVLGCDPRRLDLLLPALATRGVSSLLVEGGARTATAFLDAGLVDRILLLTAPMHVGAGGIEAPIVRDTIPAGFTHRDSTLLGPDRLDRYDLERTL